MKLKSSYNGSHSTNQFLLKNCRSFHPASHLTTKDRVCFCSVFHSIRSCASEFTYFLLEMFFVLRLLAQDLLTYSMCLTKSNSFSDRLHLSLSLQQGKDLLRILTGFRSKYFHTYKHSYHQHYYLLIASLQTFYSEFYTLRHLSSRNF